MGFGVEVVGLGVYPFVCGVGGVPLHKAREPALAVLQTVLVGPAGVEGYQQLTNLTLSWY